MHNRIAPSFLIASTLVLSLVVTACANRDADATDEPAEAADAMPGMTHDAASLAPELQAEIDRMWAATDHLANFDVAQSSGYAAKLTECMTSDQGGQGFHYGNPTLIDDNAQLDPMRPELILFEPKADGSMELVAVEYVVPLAAWTESSPPRVLGQDLHVNEQYGLWVLHVWKRPNPSGLFSDWNPDVTCPPAA